MREPTEEMFLKDVATHQMTVVLDNGIHRHIRFRRPGTYCMGFDIMAWPGYLCIAGDMGDYLFARLPDMFEFFRGKADGPLEISPRYWAEKTRNNKTTEYSPETFIASINSYLDGLETVSDELREAVNDEVLSRAHDGEWVAVTAAHEFQHGRFQFEEFYESQYKDWTYHYLWCCYAVVWGIRQYDKTKQPETAAA